MYTNRITLDVDRPQELYKVVKKLQMFLGDGKAELWKSSFKGFHFIYFLNYALKENTINALRWLLGDDAQRIWIDISKHDRLFKQVLFNRKVKYENGKIKTGETKLLFRGKLSELELQIKKYDYKKLLKPNFVNEPQIKPIEKHILGELKKCF